MYSMHCNWRFDYKYIKLIMAVNVACMRKDICIYFLKTQTYRNKYIQKNIHIYLYMQQNTQ